ncbi:TetR/AcrR family transcriptional regulator [Sporichthya sp.]|uniref:TetR/AcrR family transcriptional regulator n=1 Tax=Sporichthya sp. TaxID=65475 RepID=UPI001810A331|nr:TetR/AcrR family transcriptional regulator [Sporichthya sp.]MBA3742674.1 TetR/AcrR family transcriptional regulator [Sporichthya sp.]
MQCLSEPGAPIESVQAATGRRRREASAAEVLAATRRLLSAGDPMAQLSVERILAEAGVSRATFYACFPDKHAVVAALAQESLSWREQVSGEALADPKLTRPALDELMRAIVGHWRANRAVLAAIIELAEYDPAMRGAWRGAVDELAAQTAGHLRTRWAGSRHAPADPDGVAAALTWMFERCAHQLAVDDDSAESVALALSEILWRTVTYRVR